MILTSRRLPQDNVFDLHERKKEDCHRCKISTRPSCEVCGHSLSGQVYFSNRFVFFYTQCEVCGCSQTIDYVVPAEVKLERIIA